MSDIKNKIQDLKNFIDPYQKKFSTWYKKDKNAKKFIEVITPYKNKFFDFYKKSNRNKNIVRVGGAVLILILGKGLLGGGSKWSNAQINKHNKICIGQVDTKTNYGKLWKKYCECGTDYLSNYKKFKELEEGDGLLALGVCQHHIKGKKAERALKKDMGF